MEAQLIKSKQLLATHCSSHSQRGVVLFISLIILIAMTLAGIALVRSVDTGNLISGNLAFKQSSLLSSDRGIQAAFTWLNTNRTSLSNSNLGQGYYSSIQGGDPDWFAEDIWANAVTVGTADSAGNTVQYVVHRLCTQPDTTYNGTNAGVANQCSTSDASNIVSNAASGGSMQIGASVFQSNPMVYYRITSRVKGPRNTISIAQATVMIPV
jgi:type IV pilus assembly protein PilX